MQLLVLLGGVVRVADPAVDERRRGRDLAALGDLLRRSGSAGPGTFKPPPARARRPREQRRLFGCRAEHGKGAVDGRPPCAAAASAIRSRRSAGAVLIFERLRIAAHQRPGRRLPRVAQARARSRRSSATRSSSRACRRASRSKSAQSIMPVRHRVGRGFERRHLARPGDCGEFGVVARRRQRGHPPRQALGARRRRQRAQFLARCSRRRGCWRCSCAGVAYMNSARSPGGTSSAAISLAKLVALTQAISFGRRCATSALADGRQIAAREPPAGSARDRAAAAAREWRARRRARRAVATPASSRHGRCGRSSARRCAARRPSPPRPSGHGTICASTGCCSMRSSRKLAAR